MHLYFLSERRRLSARLQQLDVLGKWGLQQRRRLPLQFGLRSALLLEPSTRYTIECEVIKPNYLDPPLAAVDGAWGAWGAWSSCSATCDGGTRTRIRYCDNPSPSNGGSSCPGSSRGQQACNSNSCPGRMARWSRVSLLLIGWL